MLQIIKDQLKKQSEDRSYSEKKVVESIETRVKELDAAEHTVENRV